MAEIRERRGTWPRIRSYERVGLGFLIVAAATVLLGIFRDPNLTAYGVLVVLLAVGVFIGLAVPKQKDALASAFLAGLAGIWFGFFVFVPLAYLSTQAPTVLGFILAVGVGFTLGLVFGFAGGVACGFAGLLGSAVSKRRRSHGPIGPQEANGQD